MKLLSELKNHSTTSIQSVVTAFWYFSSTASRRSYFLRRAALQFLQFLQKKTGVDLVIVLPNEITELSSSPHLLLEPSFASHQLQRMGFIDKLQPDRRYWSDELDIFAFRSLKNGKVIGYGSDQSSQVKAMWKCIGETQERYLWKHVPIPPKNLVTASLTEVDAQKALTVDSLSGYSPYLRSISPDLQYTDKTKFRWVRARSVTEYGKYLCPAQLFSGHYVSDCVMGYIDGASAEEPRLCPSITTGVATGQTQTDALVSSILELIERDAFMLTYINQITPRQYDVSELKTTNPELWSRLQMFKKYNLNVSLVELVTDFPIHVVGGIVTDESGVGPAVVVCASADFVLERAITDVLSELISCRRLARGLGSVAIPENTLDFGMNERVAYWGKSSQRKKINFMLGGELIPLPADVISGTQVKMKTRYTRQHLKLLRSYLSTHNCRVYYINMTNILNITHSKLVTISAISPDLHPLHLTEKYPSLYSARLHSVPKQLGYTVTNTTNCEPHPFP